MEKQVFVHVIIHVVVLDVTLIIFLVFLRFLKMSAQLHPGQILLRFLLGILIAPSLSQLIVMCQS